MFVQPWDEVNSIGIIGNVLSNALAAEVEYMCMLFDPLDVLRAGEKDHHHDSPHICNGWNPILNPHLQLFQRFMVVAKLLQLIRVYRHPVITTRSVQGKCIKREIDSDCKGIETMVFNIATLRREKSMFKSIPFP